MQNAFDFYLPTRLCFGSGARRRLPEQLTRLGVRNLLLCTDKMLRSAGVVEKITSVLDGCADVRYTIYDDVTENPGNSVVDNGYALARELGCDGVLGLGGGSALDTATGVAMLMTNGGRALDYFHGKPVAHPSLPTILIPTTSGTGSEVTMGAVISDHDERHKYAIMDPNLVPKYAVLDPKLTVSMPKFVTATTGIDALTHAVESYVTWAYNNNASNRNAEEAVVKIFRNLKRAYEDGNDLEAREAMLIASYKAGLAFNHTGVGYVHAIAHAMGGIYNTAHGLANAVIMPIVLEDYGTAVHPQLAHLAEITGVKTTGSDAEKANAFIAAIRQMNREMGLPTGFDFIEQKDFPQIIKWALAEGNGTYPVPVIYNEARMRHVLNRIVLEA